MSSVSSAVSYQDALKYAFDGAWQLPQFQRDVKWRVKQNMLLFDSLRNDFPVGTFLTAKKGSISATRPIKFSKEGVTKEELDLLVLDGQQRITAGMQLFYADKNFHNKKQKTFYFIDLNKLDEILKEYSRAEDYFEDTKFEHIEKFGNFLDADSGYITSRNNLKDPYAPFLSKGLVFTALLRSDNSNALHTYLAQFKEKNPNKENLIKIFLQLFSNSRLYNPQVPNITVDTKDTRILTRIFSTLNNTGTSLTPFEITVSEMYGQKVDLIEDINNGASGSKYYKNIDRDRNLVLQSCILLSGLNKGHKKTDLPKTLNEEIWKKNKDSAFNSIEITGRFLCECMGVGLDEGHDYIPYDTALLPLIYLFSKHDPFSKKGKDKAFLHRLAKYYFVSAALKLRFTEGATSKQIIDKKALVTAYENGDLSVIDDVMGEKKFTGLKEVTKSGAKGRVMLCIQSANDLLDPLNDSRISLSDKHELHHIFPLSYLKNNFKIKSKDLKYNPNHIANLMIVDPATNSEFSDKNPSEQIELSKRDGNNYEEALSRHLISDKSIEILSRRNKKHTDYYEFIEQRSRDLIDHVKNRYEIGSVADDEDQVDSDEDAN